MSGNPGEVFFKNRLKTDILKSGWDQFNLTKSVWGHCTTQEPFGEVKVNSVYYFACWHKLLSVARESEFQERRASATGII